MPVTMAERPSVISAGASSDAEGSLATMCSTSDAANIPVIAAVELSGAAMANGNELPDAITAARMAEEMKVAARP